MWLRGSQIAIEEKSETQKPFLWFEFILITVTANNCEQFIQEILKPLDRWTPIPMCFIGKVNVFEKKIIPKLLYFFQNLPLPSPNNLVTQLKKKKCLVS